jgi:hypothetical protein
LQQKTCPTSIEDYSYKKTLACCRNQKNIHITRIFWKKNVADCLKKPPELRAETEVNICYQIPSERLAERSKTANRRPSSGLTQLRLAI